MFSDWAQIALVIIVALLLLALVFLVRIIRLLNKNLSKLQNNKATPDFIPSLNECNLTTVPEAVKYVRSMLVPAVENNCDENLMAAIFAAIRAYEELNPTT